MKNREILFRRCIGCNERRNKYELIRICRTPDKMIEIDSTYKKDGRGVYVCKDNPNCLEKVIKFNKFCKSLKADVPIEIINELQDKVGKIQNLY